jgi:hypothetical protein
VSLIGRWVRISRTRTANSAIVIDWPRGQLIVWRSGEWELLTAREIERRGAVERIDMALKIIEANRASDGNLQMGRAKASQVIELLRAAGGQ